MIIFWILSAGLIGLALLFVTLPLLRSQAQSEAPAQDELNLKVFKERMKELDEDLAAGFLDQTQYAAARRDLERDLLHDISEDAGGTRMRGSGGRWLAPVLGLAVPALAIALYVEVGSRDIIERMEQQAFGTATSAAVVGHEGEDLPAMEVLVQRLAERMREDPENLEGWLMLGRSYFMMRQPQPALEAISRAYALAPNEPDVMLAYAEALAANSGNNLEGKPAELIEQVVAMDADHPSALWLMGMLYYQRGQFASATSVWERVLAAMDPASEEAEDLRAMIAEARTRLGATPSAPSEVAVVAPALAAPAASADAETVVVESAPAQPALTESVITEHSAEASVVVESAATAPAATQPPAETSVKRSVTTQVTLAPEVASLAEPNDIVFIFARAAAGPPMPLAVQRISVKDLPATVTLDESMGMTPGMTIATFPELIIGARVSKSGQATPRPGDLEGDVGPISDGATAQVSVTIDRVRP
ncbi:MAG: c-type cytochrome biogenesis protein CcmI [Sphingobacteriia bacterium]|nr:c-type cytochrome biogenesis protein CcmI [Sphingobacteriia bacterium]NCC37945.1 c-type cytochrome biogenesis protein CcmI [Gammaproteobacteria bacterium]